MTMSSVLRGAVSDNGLAVAEPAKPLGSQAQLQTRLKSSSLAPHARRPVGSKAAFRRPEPATDLVRGSGSLLAHLTPTLVQQRAPRWVPDLFLSLIHISEPTRLQV